MPRLPLRVAVAGFGGYAGHHQAAIHVLEQEGECRQIAACDPSPDRFADTIASLRFAERGIPVYLDFAEMLAAQAADLDVVTIPTPIPLHQEQHCLAVAHGLGCYLEKPPSLWWPEYREMLANEASARWLTHVGYNYVGDPMRAALKARLVAGEFGALIGASFTAAWPRNLAYYRRNNWAGRLVADGRPVLDSPIGNGQAHHVQDLLQWCGGGDAYTIAEPEFVRAQLFRANPITSWDTAFVEIGLAGGRWIRLAASHAGTRSRDCERVICEKAVIRLDSWRAGRIEWRDGSVEPFESARLTPEISLQDNLRRYFRYLRGEEVRPVTRLADSASHVAVCDLALLSAGEVREFEAGRVRRKGEGAATVDGLDEALAEFADEGIWPDATRPPRAATPDELDALDAPGFVARWG